MLLKLIHICLLVLNTSEKDYQELVTNNSCLLDSLEHLLCLRLWIEIYTATLTERGQNQPMVHSIWLYGHSVNLNWPVGFHIMGGTEFLFDASNAGRT